jgi:hypothetical protein
VPPFADAVAQDGDLPPSSASSAVSRFLNRFSRSRPSSSPSRNSLTLSGDDLEYLSDVRSNSTDPMDTGDEQLEFGSTAPSGFLHGKLPPPLPLPSLPLSNATTSPPPSLGPLVRDDKTNGPIIISPVNPNPGVLLDARKPTEQSSVFALIPLIPRPIQTNSSKSIRHNSISLSSDKINPSLCTTLLPTPSRGAVQRTDVSHDDFSDFLSSPADPPLLTFSASPPSSQERVPPSHGRSMSSDDDFANLMSLSTGGLPDSSKRPDAALTPNSAVAPAKPTPSIAQRRKGSREEHLHTLGLLERAAARPGRWPAPPSPLPEVLTPPPPPESAPSSSTDLDILDIGPAHAHSNHQRHPSTSKETTTSSPSKAAVKQGHQRTQSLLDLAASRPGRWPAPPSPYHEALPPPPPPARNQGVVGLNVDYFGTTPTEDSFTFPPPPPPPGKTSPPPSLSNTISMQMTLGRDALPSTGLINAIQSSSSPPHPSVPPTGLLSRRTLSPPPLTTAVINKVPPKLPSAPIPLLPPPGGYRLTPPSNPPSRQYSPESTPLALLVDSGKEKLPTEKATRPLPVKGTGGLTAQDLSFFEGL